jgi:hypothetical protein
VVANVEDGRAAVAAIRVRHDVHALSGQFFGGEGRGTRFGEGAIRFSAGSCVKVHRIVYKRNDGRNSTEPSTEHERRCYSRYHQRW